VRRIVDEAYEDVLALLREHRSKLDDLAVALLDRETLDGPDAYAVAGIERVLTVEDLRDTAPAPA
jgi:cell division protease FtsH